MSITIIRSPEPEFKVTLYQAKEAKAKPLVVKVANVALGTIKGVGFLTYEFAKSTVNTLKLSPTSFKYVVLGYYGDGQFKYPTTAYLALFRVAFWMFSIGYSILENAISATAARYASRTMLKVFMPTGINQAHLVTKEVNIDVSKVPGNIKVDTLLELFDGINFDDKQKQGYVSPKALREDKDYSKEEGRAGLKKFVENVNGRVAFLGTPAATNMPKLLAFYQHIENCVRASIHASNEKIAKFEAENGANYDEMNAETKKAYDNLLEDRARIVIDMAIAGMHCGARYMGESTSTYYANCGEGDSFLDDNLQVTMQEILGQERRKIAENEIFKVSRNTHDYTAYMSALGEELAIPGAQNVSEQLSSLAEKDKKLASFFNEYSIDRIITTINEKVKTSQAFREKVIDWMKDNAGEWNKAAYEAKAQEIVAALQPVLQGQNFDTADLQAHVAVFTEIAGIVEVAVEGEWEEFLNNFFAHDAAKKFLSDKYSKLIDRMNYTRKLKATAMNPLLKPLLEKIAKKEVVPAEEILSVLQGIAKAKEVTEILIEHDCPYNADTVSQIVGGKLDLEKAVRNLVGQKRGPDFIAALKLGEIVDEEKNQTKIERDGLTPELLEWILVSQGILMPQEYIAADSKDESQAFTKDQIKFLNRKFNIQFVDHPTDYLNDLIKAVVVPGSNTLRYRGELGKELILRTLFEKEFQDNSEKLLTAYESKGVKVRAFSSIWKTTWIKIPKKISEVTGKGVFKVAAYALTFFAAIYVGYEAFNAVEFFVTARAIPFFINNATPEMINVLNRSWEAVEYIRENFVMIAIYSTAISWAIRQLPRIPVLTTIANQITPFTFINIWLSGEGFFGFIARRGFEAAGKVHSVFTWINEKSGMIAHESQLLYAAKTKAKFYPIWKRRFAEIAV